MNREKVVERDEAVGLYRLLSGRVMEREWRTEKNRVE